MAQTREKFATQVKPDILAAVRRIAAEEGRQIQALIDEALADLVEKRRADRPRRIVMDAYSTSHEKFSALYKKLAE